MLETVIKEALPMEYITAAATVATFPMTKFICQVVISKVFHVAITRASIGLCMVLMDSFNHGLIQLEDLTDSVDIHYAQMYRFFYVFL